MAGNTGENVAAMEKPPYRFAGTLPAALAQLIARRQWVCWDYVWNAAKAKWDKPPLSAHTGRLAKGGATKPDNWGTHEEALATMRRCGLAGIGYAIAADDDITGIDLDHCITDSGSLTALTAEVLAYGETYAEISPSGEGIRLFARGKYTGGVIKKDALGVEVYTAGRYLTVTGDQVNGSPDTIAPAPRTLARLAEAAGVEPAKPAANGHAKPAGGDFFANVNAAALGHLDEWVPVLHPAARKHATGAWRVTSKDFGRALEEDLAYHPDGIRDHGEEVSLTAIDAVLKYGDAADATAAARWLCRHMGVEASALGWRKHKPTSKPDVSLSKPIKLIKFSDIRITTQRRFLIHGLIPRVGPSIIWGPPKCGKSFWLFDLLMHVALGWNYRGRRVHSGPVVYCAFEGQEGFADRVEAFRQRFLSEHTADVPFVLMPTPLALVADHVALIEAIKSAMTAPPVAVGLDTLNRSITGSESNDKDMTAYLNAAQAIEQAFTCSVPIVHHCGIEGTRPRGHTSITGTAVAQLAVNRPEEDGPFTVTVEYMKDGRSGAIIGSQLNVVPVGIDEDGSEITSCVVVGAEEAEKRARGRPPGSDRHIIALRALDTATREKGQRPSSPLETGTSLPSEIEMPGRVVTVENWKHYAVMMGAIDGDAEPKVQNQALKRVLRALVTKNQIGNWGGFVWEIKGQAHRSQRSQ